MSIPKKLQDCYFYYYSACRKVRPQFRSHLHLTIYRLFFFPGMDIFRERVVRIGTSRLHWVTSKCAPSGKRANASKWAARSGTWLLIKHEIKSNATGKISRAGAASPIASSSTRNDRTAAATAHRRIQLLPALGRITVRCLQLVQSNRSKVAIAIEHICWNMASTNALRSTRLSMCEQTNNRNQTL